MLGVTTVRGRRLKDRPNIITRAETVLVDADPSSESRKTLEQPLSPPPTPWLTRTYGPTMQWRRSANCPNYLLEVPVVCSTVRPVTLGRNNGSVVCPESRERHNAGSDIAEHTTDGCNDLLCLTDATVSSVA
ncbi:hypothetical protein C0Q70_15709 [Pomacea canaliculata]|uniref:Uncharacterized protein n=1 Tax=Pomacea canaliculata TaxID=400727 RepID=A0A2T7NVL4_POMCA|nr:hypothetical protein C0Q70_15709 [Pomacea canaliculata]